MEGDAYKFRDCHWETNADLYEQKKFNLMTVYGNNSAGSFARYTGEIVTNDRHGRPGDGSGMLRQDLRRGTYL